MNEHPSGPKTPEQIEYERLLAEFQAKKQQLERKAQLTRHQIVANMKERKERIEYYQGRIRRMNEMLALLDNAPRSFERELTRERILASREVFDAGLAQAEIQLRDYKANYEGISGTSALDMIITDSTSSYEYRAAKARSLFASARLTLIDFKPPMEVLEHVVTCDPERFEDSAEPEIEAPVEKIEEIIEPEPQPPEEGEEEEEAEKEITLDEAIREVLGEDGVLPAEASPARAISHRKAPSDEPPVYAWEEMTAETRRNLRAFIDANAPIKTEVAMAIGYYREALEVLEEADAILDEMQRTPNHGLLRRLTQDGDNLLGKINGKLFYLSKLPERMIEIPEIAALLPEPAVPDPEAVQRGTSRAMTAPLQGDWARPIVMEAVVPQESAAEE